ncbi:hypothetical protein PENPOL_c002G08136 [Penicillium polonicum]|uniref:Uncharacterized protein n=1 Tax=Penicillium polonicum TaxID=60169 RepID=A0A1V6NXT0_PENPO|nr:hypothetical protein PENPOL_c002G08136 [Penicillium polonicum]
MSLPIPPGNGSDQGQPNDAITPEILHLFFSYLFVSSSTLTFSNSSLKHPPWRSQFPRQWRSTYINRETLVNETLQSLTFIAHNMYLGKLRNARWPADFNTDGDIVLERWPMGDAVVLWMHGLPFLPQRIGEDANELDPHQHCLKRLRQTEEQHNAAVNTEWTEEQDETPRVGKTFKWSEVDGQKPLWRRRTAAPAAKRRRLAKILVATEPAPSSPSAASTAPPSITSTPEPSMTERPQAEADTTAAMAHPQQETRRETKDAATMTEHGMGTIDAQSTPNPEIQVLDAMPSLGTLQSFYNLARLEASRSFTTLMTAVSRIEALAASCGSSKKTHTFLRMAGEHKMAPAEAEALFERTMQPTLPSYMNTTLSSIVNTKESAEIRDALRFAQSLAAFKAALEKHQHLSQYSRSEHWTLFANFDSGKSKDLKNVNDFTKKSAT